MPRLPPVLIPPELELDLSAPKALDLRYDGNVCLGQTFGRVLGAVWAGGDLDLELPLVNGTCVSGGVLRTSADIDAVRLSAREVHLTGRNIRARAISASERIVIGQCVLKVDVIIAPIIEIHAKAGGRVTVIESHNDRKDNRIKGCFTLTEYEELFGDSETFLSSRGVAPLRANTPTGAAPRAMDPFDEVPTLAVEDLEEVEPLDEHSIEEMETIDGPVEEYSSELLEPIDDEDSDVIQPVRRPLPRRSPSPMPPRRRTPSPLAPPRRQTAALGPWLERMRDLVVRMADDYDPYPPRPLLELQGLIEEGRRSELERALPNVWQQLILHHRQQQAPVNPRVSHGFRVLNDLLEVGPG